MSRNEITGVKFRGTGCVEAVATFEDGDEKRIFSYFDDEISFSEKELIGLTQEEAHDLFHEKDLAYLRG